MKELRTETIQMPNLARQGTWQDLFMLLMPKVSGISLDDFVELRITAANLQIVRVVNDERNN